MTLIKSISGIRGTIGGRAGEGLTPIDIVKFTAAYGKIIVQSKKFHAHNDNNEAKAGDLVEIEETRPISKTKAWRVTKLLEKAVVV